MPYINTLQTSNDQALERLDHFEPFTLYDPESMTFEQQRAALEKVYIYSYPWHNTEEARSYDYPTFEEAIREWAKDEFYRQHLTAKLYCETLDWVKTK
ncbi:hypothetical protein MVUOKPPV_CDS0303 [Klebsiella phage phi1_175008]|uniref:Uncharacterized protein n=2 Tax=Klebsiella phage phi1_175008 TaxID=3127744 RepID=A0AC61ZTE7_9CAUD